MQTVGTVTIALVCIVAISLLQIPQLRQLQTVNTPFLANLQQELTIQKIQLNLLKKTPTLGFDNLIADWVFLNFLQYFGDEPARHKTGYELSPVFFDIIIGHNPYFFQAYSFLSTSTALYAGMPERSVALMNQGLKFLTPTIPPSSFYVWRNKGIDELLFLGNAQAAQQSFEMAATWASQSGLPDSQRIASLSQQTAQFLAKNPNSKTAQVAAWAMVLENAPDSQTQHRAIARIRELGGQVVITAQGAVKVVPPPKD
jgi:hypothetical protein